jgi:hypothetical protein
MVSYRAATGVSAQLPESASAKEDSLPLRRSYHSIGSVRVWTGPDWCALQAEPPDLLTCAEEDVNLCVAWVIVMQEDLVGLSDVVGFDGSGPLPRCSGVCRSSLRSWWRALWGGALRISPRVPR